MKKNLIKFIAAFLIAVVSITGANMINQILGDAQNKVVKSYKKKRTEERSFKNIEEANAYIFEKGNKIESIAKELGIEYVMSDDKGLFYYSDETLKGPKYKEISFRRYPVENSIEIGWATAISEYSDHYSDKPTTTFYENVRISSYGEFLEKEKFKDNLVVKFLHKYLVKIENKNITYDELLNDIQETAQKAINQNTNEEVRLQLIEGLYILFRGDYKIEVKMNTAYRERVVKEVKSDINDYFISAKNSKEVKDRILGIYEQYHKLNEEAGHYKYNGAYGIDYDESVMVDMGEPGIGTFYYNNKAYPNLTKEDKIYAIKFYVSSHANLEDTEYSLINYKKLASENGLRMYDVIKNEIYNGNYKLSKEEFISKFIKHSLNKELEIIPNGYNVSGIDEITPGIRVSEGGVRCEIPLVFY